MSAFIEIFSTTDGRFVAFGGHLLTGALGRLLKAHMFD